MDVYDRVKLLIELAFWLCIAVVICICAGCTHRIQETVRVDRGDGKPPVKITRTITETVKVDRPVPVYRMESTIEHHTKTESTDKNNVAPLHKAEVVAPVVPDATKP